MAAGRLVERGRLLAVLREQRRRLTVIHAPAGYGKTTLALQWVELLRAEGCRVAWLNLRPADSTPATLVGHLLEAARAALGESEGGPLATLRGALEQGDGARFVLTALLDEVRRRDVPLLVVFDDWHVLVDPEATQLLGVLVEDAPDTVSVLLTARHRPAVAVSRWRVGGQLTEIGPELLRFDVSESRAFLVERGGPPLPAETVHQVIHSADGWVAALQLAALSLREQPDSAGLVAGLSGRHHMLGEYLAENVLDALPPELLEVLLRTSVADRLCAGLVDALTGRTDGYALLAELQRRELFLRPLDPEHTWYRYHQLFANHLRGRLERTHPGVTARLHEVASGWFAAHDLIADAVDHALAGGHIELAVQLVERHAMSQVEHSRMTTALGLLAKLPPSQVRSRPSLLLVLAWANCLLQRSAPAQDALDQLCALPAEDTALAREIDVAQACVDVYADRVDRAQRLVEPGLRPRSCRPFVGGVAANIASFVQLSEFRFGEALAVQARARQVHRSTLGPFPGVYGRCFAGLAAWATLDLDGAARHLHAALGLARDLAGLHSHAARLAGALIGELHYERDELAEADALLEESRELGAESGVVDFMLASFGTLARCRAAAGDPAAALALLAEGLAVAERLNLPRLAARMLSEQVRLLLHTGRTREALRTAQTLPDGSRCHAGIATQIEWLRTATLGRVLVADGNVTAAIGLCETLLERTAAAGHPFWQLRARLQLACAQEAGQFRGRATATLVPALRQAAAAGLCRTVLDAGPEIEPMLGRLARPGAEDARGTAAADVPPEYVHGLLRRAARAPTSMVSGQPATALAAAAPAAPVPSAGALVPQELRILAMLERGLTNAAVAGELRISVNTVKWYLKNIYGKLGVANRTQCVVAYRRIQR